MEDSPKLIDNLTSHLHHCYGLRCTREEHKAEVSCCGHQSTLVWRLGLVEELPYEDMNMTRTEMVYSIWKMPGV